jgi:hypothetical protein
LGAVIREEILGECEVNLRELMLVVNATISV